MRKIISLVIASVLLLALFTLAVSAGGNQVALISGGTTTEYADYKDGFKAAKAGDTVKLLTDITLYGSESLTVSAGSDLTVDGNGKTIYSPYTCFYCPSASETNRTKLTLKNLKIDCTEKSGKHSVQIASYIDLLVENCDFKSSYDGVCVEGVYNKITLKDSSLYSAATYGIRAKNCNEYLLENTKITSSGGSCIEVASKWTPAAEITLKNCEFTANGNFCLWLQGNNNATIEGGTYTTVGSANKPAAIYVDGGNSNLTIKDGTFSCDYGSAITVKGASTVNIEGGTFNYTGAGAGSALVASAGTVNITGGTFVSNGTDAVINVTGADANVTITRATCTNKGSAAVPAYANNGQTVESFPAGATTVTIPVPPETEPETTTGSPEVTSSEPEVTTSEPEVTTSGTEVTTTGSVVTTSTPEATTAKPEVTTSAPAPSTGENTQMLFVICGVVFLALAAVVVVKIREKI